MRIVFLFLHPIRNVQKKTHMQLSRGAAPPDLQVGLFSWHIHAHVDGISSTANPCFPSTLK